jgi:hypothetical protein
MRTAESDFFKTIFQDQFRVNTSRNSSGSVWTWDEQDEFEDYSEFIQPRVNVDLFFFTSFYI